MIWSQKFIEITEYAQIKLIYHTLSLNNLVNFISFVIHETTVSGYLYLFSDRRYTDGALQLPHL